MSKRSILLLLALLACLMAATRVRAEASDDDFDATGAADDEEPEEDYIADSKDPATSSIDARVLFPDYDISALKIPAGEKVSTYVSFQNKVGGTPSQLFIVAAHLNQIGNNDAFVQNFSAVRTARTVNGGETATIHYEFRPDALLEPMDYNLVIRVFFLNEENTTFVAAAYNSTVTIVDPLGTDFKGIMTYVILIAIIGGVSYLFTNKNNSAITTAAGKKSISSTTGASSPATKSSSPSAAAAGDKAYNTEYVSAEHLKFREQLLKAASDRSGSPKTAGNRKASPKK